MRYTLVLSTDEPELAWNALRFGVAALGKGHHVTLFLLGRGVELEGLHDAAFDVGAQLRAFRDRKGAVEACGTCLDHRGLEGTDVCPPSTMARLLALTEEADRVLTFG